MPDLWERRKGESAQAWEAARLYFELGASRSLDAVSQKLVKSRTLLSRWSGRWEWVDRAREWDAWVAAEGKRALVDAARAQAVAWQKRDEEDRARKFDIAQRFLARVEKMLEFPLATVTTETSEDGGQTIRRTTVRPVRWSLDTTNRMTERAFKLTREAIRNDEGLDGASTDLRDEEWEIEDFTA